jgi:hypothetical protein
MSVKKKFELGRKFLKKVDASIVFLIDGKNKKSRSTSKKLLGVGGGISK